MKPVNLPDILSMPGGRRAATAAQWVSDCRPWLMETVLREEYGMLPPEPKSIEIQTIRVDANVLNGRATLREIDIASQSPDANLRLLLLTPNQTESPSPCFLGLNFHGNHTVIDHPSVRPPEALLGTDYASNRGRNAGAWQAAKLIDRGYALATMYNGDAVPDSSEAALSRLLDFVPPNRPARPGDAPGTIACWAWSLRRALDALERMGEVDSHRIAVMGHSRNGKTALLAAAIDPRPAVAIICQSGCGGIGPSRDIGEEWSSRETVKQINDRFPHWFCANFKKYNYDVDLLPFDQHALVALCAPKPLLLASALGDLWANPKGSFEMLLAAAPVYRLMGLEGTETKTMPTGSAFSLSRLGHFVRTGAHAVTEEDWDAFLAFADRWMPA